MTDASNPDLISLLGPAFIKQSLHLGSALDQTGQLSLYNSSSALPTILQAGNATATVTYTLPTAGPTGNNYLLGSSTVGVLSWFDFSSTGSPTFAGETITAATSGGSVLLTVSNTSNTASSDSLLDLVVAGTSAGDAYIKTRITGNQVWSFGLDNSDSDAWVLSSAATLGSTNVFHVIPTGEINLPLQPSFLATANGSDQTDVTGDGTAVTVNFATEVFDQNADYDNSSMTFTAPVTGRYLLCVQVKLAGLLITHTTIRMNLLTSNRNYQQIYDESALSFSGLPCALSVIADMDAADTASVQVNVSGGTKVVDIIGGATQTFFSGSLLN